MKDLERETPHLYRYAQSLTRDRHDADDLVQDCLERALRRRDQFEAGTQLRRWLFTILRNINIDNQRRNARRGTHVEVNEWQSATHQPASQEHHIALLDTQRRLDNVRPCDRDILILSVFGGFTHEQIAREKKIAVGTVKSRLSRTRAVLAT